VPYHAESGLEGGIGAVMTLSLKRMAGVLVLLRFVQAGRDFRLHPATIEQISLRWMHMIAGFPY
jgi:hypothetical protein